MEAAMADLFPLSDQLWAVIEPLMPTGQSSPKREDGRKVNSGILQGLTSGCRWRDCPTEYGPRTTVYDRFNRWSRCGFWRAMLVAPAKAGWAGDTAAIDSTYVRADRSVRGGKGGPRRRPSVRRTAGRRPGSTP